MEGVKCLFRLLELLISRDLARFEGKLDQILNQQIDHNMKLSDVKAAVAEASANATEAFAELSQLLADQQAKIDQLIADQADPTISDEVFAANLQNVSDTNKKLASIVTPVEPPPVEPPVA